MRHPLLGGVVAITLRRRVEVVQVLAFAELPDALKRFGDVLLGDVLGPGQAGVQGDPADRPVHRLPGRACGVAERDGFLDQGTGAQVDSHLGGRVDDPQLPGAQHPRVVERDVPAQREEQQVGAGPEGDREGRCRVRFAGQPADPFHQRGGEPVGHVRPALHEHAVVPQLGAAVARVDVLPVHEREVLGLGAVSRRLPDALRGHREQGCGGDRSGPHVLAPPRPSWSSAL